MIRVGRMAGLIGVVLSMLVLVACNTGTLEAPTSAPATQPPAAAATNTSAPAAATATQAPEATATATEAPPTEAPTQPPAAQASPTAQRETVSFGWAPGSVAPSDADDVADIFNHLRAHEGIFGGTGDENGINVIFDPNILTIEDLEEIFASIGHPVIRK
jgi:hypothetical protein